MYRLVRPLLLAGLLLALSSTASSQNPVKRPIKHTDYASWRAIQAPAISPDGTVVIYALAPQEGDGEFIARNLNTGKEFRHPRGNRPTVMVPPSARAGRGAARGPSAHLFGADGKSALFPIYPTTAQRKASAKSKTATPLTGALGIMDLANGKVVRVDSIRAYQVNESGTPFVAYHLAPKPTKGDPSKKTRAKGKAPEPKASATDLVLRNLTTAKERTLRDVTEFSLAKNGGALVFVVKGAKDAENGVFVIAPGQDNAPLPLRTGAGTFSKLTWDEDQTQVVFFHAMPAQSKGAKPLTRLCHWKRSANMVAKQVVSTSKAQTQPAAIELTPNGKPAVKAGWTMTDQAPLNFSRDGKCVYFGLVPPPPSAKTTTQEEKPDVELWHYKDDYIQSVQKVRHPQEQKRSYTAVFHLADRHCRQLGDETLATIVRPEQGEWCVGQDDRAYRLMVGQTEFLPPVDGYLVNTKTGQRKRFVQKRKWGLAMSPEGKFVLSFDGKNWCATSTATGKTISLTAKLTVSLVNELNDVPGDAAPYGIAGWTTGDKQVLLYDRYDIWSVATDGSEARNITKSIGRKKSTTLRLVTLDPKKRAFGPEESVLLRAENEKTRDTGFYKVSLKDGTVKLLLMGARNYGTPMKAAKGERLLLTVQTFSDFPDLYSTTSSFKEIKRITNANPQKANLLWGKAELISYKCSDGTALQGMLIKPENFDPKKKYPMMVYIYERLSQRLHGFINPQPGTSINPTYYASNGYLVLMPDIVYTTGHPGQSAQKCVLPAVQAVVDKGFVNEKAIGLQGHSWGGYQTAYLITQTTRFKAASAGAPVCNMTSAYGGIRWGSGLPRQFQYEKGQSRIGGSLWQQQSKYVENSPLFHADRIKTPLLMLHNDQDEAVPYQQGLEYYLALRRLGKEVYLFNYRGEAHGLRKRVNQKDYTLRLQQFFDHHLKGAAKPEWMRKGKPYTPPPRTQGPARTPGAAQ